MYHLFEPVESENGENGEHDSWIFDLALRFNQEFGASSVCISNNQNEVFNNIVQFVHKMNMSNNHISILFARPDYWERKGESTLNYLFKLWDSNRSNLTNGITYIFFHYSRKFNQDSVSEFWTKLKIPIYQNVFEFPVLSKEETDYTITRFATIADRTIEESYKNEIFELSGGYYPLVSNTTKIITQKGFELSSESLEQQYSSPVVQNFMKILFESFSIQQISDVKASIVNGTLNELGLQDKSGKLISKWLKKYLQNYKLPYTDFVVEPEYLSPEELIIFRYLLIHENTSISKEEIANVIWKDRAVELYSEWVIDKQISRIRNKLEEHQSQFDLVTIRGYGFHLSRRSK